MGKESTLTAEALRAILHYDPETGHFTWLEDRGRIRVGDRAGSLQWLGRTAYLYICIDHKQHRAHRLAWLYMTGKWPEDMLDHRDGDGSNNRFANLREATGAQNSQAPNKRMLPQNTSGYTGVSTKKGRNKWNASIAVNRRRIYLGSFSTAEEASAAYLAAKRRLHAFMGDEVTA